MRVLYFHILLFISSVNLFAQEAQLNQFYTNPSFINPAFTGDTYFTRGMLSSRISSPISGEYYSNTVLSVDQKIRNHRSGIGLTLYNQRSSINHTKAQLNYSYTVNLTKKFSIKGGLGIAFNQKRISTNDYSFPDQYNHWGYTGNPTNEPSLNERAYYPGLNAGILLYSKYFWIGSAFDNINRPVENYAGLDQTIPMKFSIHSGIAYPIYKNVSSRRRFSKFGGLEPHTTIGPIFSFMSQDQYSHLNIGLAVHSQPFFGCLNYSMINQFIVDRPEQAYKAIGIALGYRREEISVSYSYESSLISSKVNKNGTHEISIAYFFSSVKNDHRRNKLVPLPNQILY